MDMSNYYKNTWFIIIIMHEIFLNALGGPVNDFVESVHCQFESVNLTCGVAESLIIDQAKYGRVQINRCVERDYGHLGCYADVTTTLGGWCSGAQGCHFRVTDVQDTVENPCTSQLTSALSLQHRCLHVDNAGECGESRQVVLNRTEGYLSTAHAYTTGVGMHVCPIVLQALPGQTVNLTLYSYAPPSTVDSALSLRHERSKCAYHVTVTERDVIHTLYLCGGVGEGVRVAGEPRPLYTSQTQSLSLHFMGRFDADHRYLLQYTVHGCPALRPPGAARFTLTGEGRAEVHCPHTREAWFVTCVGTTWLGRLGDCEIPKKPNENEDDSPFPFSLTVAVLVGLLLGILIGLLLLTLVCLYRKRLRLLRQRRRQESKLLGGGADEPPLYEPRDPLRHQLGAAHQLGPAHQLIAVQHPCRACECDGRCMAPTTLCGHAQVYSPQPTHNTVSRAGSNPDPQPFCHYHGASSTLLPRRQVAPSPLMTRSAEDGSVLLQLSPLPSNQRQVTSHNDVSSALTLEKPDSRAAPQKTATFSTFKPTIIGTDSPDRTLTNHAPKGILKHVHQCEDVSQCACANGHAVSNEAYALGARAQPDVVQTNHNRDTVTRNLANSAASLQRRVNNSLG